MMKGIHLLKEKNKKESGKALILWRPKKFTLEQHKL